MTGLEEMWRIGGFLTDQNGDGVPDRVNVSVRLPKDFIPVGLIDFCGRLGFETTALSYGFLDESDAEWKLTFHNSSVETSCILVEGNKEVMITYQSLEELNDLLRYLASEWPTVVKESESVTKIIWKDHHLVLYFDDFTSRVTQWNKVCSSTGEQTVISSLTDIWNGTGFLMNEDPSPFKENNIFFDFQVPPDTSLLKQCCYMAARVGMSSTKVHFPLTGIPDENDFTFCFHLKNKKESSIHLNESGTGITFVGDRHALTHMMKYVAQSEHVSEGGEFGEWEQRSYKTENEQLLFQLEWEDRSEVERAREVVDRILMDEGSCKTLSLELFISEPASIREAFKKELVATYDWDTISVYSAFKPAYFWIEETVLPKLHVVKELISSIEIECVKEKGEGGLELPIRWIQELYPVDLLIEREIGVSSENVTFSLLEESDSTINMKVFGDGRNLLLEESISIPVSRVGYVEEGKYAYPTTGYIKVTNHKQTLFEKHLPTDRELFYDFYQKEVLPSLWKETLNRNEGQGFTKPLFDRVTIDVSMSEEERRLNIDEERISSMEALHEDLYFNTLDYFMARGEREFGQGFPAPGGIYPFMRVKTGMNPKATIKAYPWEERNLQKVLTKKLIFRNKPNSLVAEIYEPINQRTYEWQVNLDQKREWNYHLSGYGVGSPLVRQWVPANSYRGEEIPVFEMMERIEEQFISTIKCSVYKPTVLVEAGHHPNEVSSTPAILELLHEVATTHQQLLKTINLVIIPCANPDGAVLHQKMIQDNPEWKHHAARYNAVGLEYTHMRYQETVFGEADVVPLIMKRWAPDIVVDDHGIPSHEWVQPFAGYNSPPRFPVSYWMPNALIYGIGRELNKGEFPTHVHNLEVIAEEIDRKIKSTPISDQNTYWINRVKKFGHQWLPEVFPVEQTNELLFYKWHTTTKKQSPIAIERFPEWIGADIISEAADETVYGEALDICKEAHKLFDLAIFETAARTKVDVNQVLFDSSVEIYRQRPLKLEGVKENENIAINRV
jgi:Zinc carboxypeptidase